jgi:hypothetical protein
MRKIFYFISNFFLILLPRIALARDYFPLDNPLNVDTVKGLLDRITSFLIDISAPIVTIMILIGAFKMLTAGGDENKFKEGKKTITYAVIGMTIVLISKGIALVIKDFLGVKK